MARSPDIEAERRPNEVLSFATEPGDVIAFRTSTLHGGALILTRQRGGHSRCVILAKIVISRNMSVSTNLVTLLMKGYLVECHAPASKPGYPPSGEVPR